MITHNEVATRAIDEVLAETNADPDLLDAVLDRQNYRLAFWRTADRDLGYRRFFDINSLVGLRSENQPVFANVHALPLRWASEGLFHGLRIDHIDGLRDPAVYLQAPSRRRPSDLDRGRENSRPDRKAARRLARRGNHGL